VVGNIDRCTLLFDFVSSKSINVARSVLSCWSRYSDFVFGGSWVLYRVCRKPLMGSVVRELNEIIAIMVTRL
jgi:hypothetical protein